MIDLTWPKDEMKKKIFCSHNYFILGLFFIRFFFYFVSLLLMYLLSNLTVSPKASFISYLQTFVACNLSFFRYSIHSYSISRCSMDNWLQQIFRYFLCVLGYLLFSFSVAILKYFFLLYIRCFFGPFISTLVCVPNLHLHIHVDEKILWISVEITFEKSIDISMIFIRRVCCALKT